MSVSWSIDWSVGSSVGATYGIDEATDKKGLDPLHGGYSSVKKEYFLI